MDRAPVTLPPAGQFVSGRPKDIREARPWHRYAYHIHTLPARLEALSRELNVKPGDHVLDFGCADIPYRYFFPDAIDFVPADLPGNPLATMKIRPDGTLPVDDDSFDAVLSTQVLEHVEDPRAYLSECFRVLRPGGRLLVSTHGMFIFHPDPVDFWRWTGAGLEREISNAGFGIVRTEGIIGLAATGIQLFQDAVLYKVPRRVQPVVALASQSFIKLLDRRTSDESRRMNAQVFGVVAEKP